jgi:UMF1 family MFS transporter
MKNRFLWYLYDFANSIALIGLLYYFGIWVVVERGGSQWMVGLPVSLATLALLIIMPKIARKVDANGTHKKNMIIWSVGAALTLLTLSLVGGFVSLGWIFFLYFLFNFFFQAGYIFSSSLLHTISDETNRSKISGTGQAWGQAGNLVGVIISFITVSHFMVGASDKLNVFFWSAIVFLLLLIPASRFRLKGTNDAEDEDMVYQTMTLRDSSLHQHDPNLSTEVAVVDKSLIKKLREQPRIARFLFAYALYSDAVVTLSLFIALYLKKVIGFTDGQIRIASVVLLVCTIIGGLLVSRLVSQGRELKVISRFLIAWPIVIFIFAFMSGHIPIYVLIAFIGFAMSVIFAVSRAYYAIITPKDKQAEYFSVFVIFERVGAIAGPILWSTVVSIAVWMGATESTAYRIAIVSVALITAIGYFILRSLHVEDVKKTG